MHARWRRAIAVLAVAALAAVPAGCAAPGNTGSEQSTPLSANRSPQNPAAPPGTEFEAAASAVSSVVVDVQIMGVNVPHHPQVHAGDGSGIVIRRNGYILTNDHVVSMASSLAVSVGGVPLPVRVVGRDAASDLAVLKIPATDLPVAQIGDSTALKPGQWVIAVGTPYGLPHSVSTGIVSGVNRASSDPSGIGASTYTDLIQTDAAVNPGNSGGALATLDGRIVGVTSLGEGPTSGSTGVNFAIPMEFAMSVASQLIATGHAVHPYLGLDVLTLEPHAATMVGVGSSVQGVLVRSVSPTGPAVASGVKDMDVIVALAGQPTPDAGSYYGAVREQSVGTTVPLTVVRRDTTLTVQAKVGQN